MGPAPPDHSTTPPRRKSKQIGNGTYKMATTIGSLGATYFF